MNLYAYILQRMAKIKLINTPMFSGVCVCVCLVRMLQKCGAHAEKYIYISNVNIFLNVTIIYEIFISYLAMII